MASYTKVRAKNKKGYTWKVSIEAGINPETGKRKQITRRGFKTRKEAENEVANILNKLENEEYFTEKKIYLKEFILEWLEVSAKQTVKSSTLNGYRSAIQSRIIPKFGNSRIKDLKPTMFLRYYNELIEEGISEEYIQYIHVILKHSLSFAVKWQYVKQNPMTNVSPPSRRRKKVNTWSIEECQKFLRLQKKHNKIHRYMLYYLAIFTGMRRGEILGLQWSDINFENHVISITKSLYYISGKGITQQHPKTDSGMRTIALSESVIIALSQYRKEKKAQLFRAGMKLTPSCYVISDNGSSPINPQTVHKFFLYDIKRSEVPRIRFHDLRHTHATIMLQLGEHAKVVSERLGHADVQTTLNLYSHVTPNMQKDSAIRFDEAFKNIHLQ
ncbi:site-specific integrase [Halobacillus ihumii]|uniref:site-specific integrase n=1 Tax=Halobacillus ihumii TaxID=2686092 RepID=UPI0013D03F4C|nr:site-specific integrase [Halobacillus ihumii]